MRRLAVLFMFLLGTRSITAQAPVPQPGWPVDIVSVDFTVADLDQDGLLEVVVNGGGLVHALDHSGLPLTGWPASASGSTRGPPIVGDLDGDGLNEVVYASLGSGNRRYGAIDDDGTAMPGWPVFYAAPAGTGHRQMSLGDLDGDGSDEVVLIEKLASEVFRVVALNHQGEQQWTHLFSAVGSVPQVAVADLEFDGASEVLVTVGWLDGSSVETQIWVLEGNGTVRPGWPQDEPGSADLYFVSAVDLDGDGECEIIGSGGGRTYIYGADGTLEETLFTWLTSEPAFPADLDGDGGFEFVSTGGGISVMGDTGSAWYSTLEFSAPQGLVVGDADGDGDQDFLFYTSGWQLHLVDAATLEELPGFPMTLAWGGATFPSRETAMADLDADGDVEIIFKSGNGIEVYSIPNVGTETPKLEWPVYGKGPKQSFFYHEGALPVPRFVRGDANADGFVDVADVVSLLSSLFVLAPDFSCPESLDVDGDGGVGAMDPLALLDYLFVGGPMPPSPFPSCGEWDVPLYECSRIYCGP